MTSILYAFDLLELNGKDQRLLPREERKASLADLLTPAVDGIELSERRDCVSPCLQTRLRRHSVEAARLDISL